MKCTESQTGFSLIHVLLLIVLFAMIGFTGWKVYDATNADNGTANNAQTTNTQQKPASSKYLEVKEWGVKLPLGDEIADLQYEVMGTGANVNDKTQPFIKFYTKKFKDLGLVCESNYALITLTRGKADDTAIVGEGLDIEDKVEFTNQYRFEHKTATERIYKFEDYYYTPLVGGRTCAVDVNTDIELKEFDKKLDVEKAIEKMERL